MFSLQSEWQLPVHFRGFRANPGQAQSCGLWEEGKQAQRPVKHPALCGEGSYLER